MIEPTILHDTQSPSSLPLPRVKPLRDALGSYQLLRRALPILGICLLTFVLYLYVLPNSQISEATARIEELRSIKTSLARQNAEIVRSAVPYTDLATIQQRAKQLGMGPARRYMYLYVTADRQPASPVPGSTGLAPIAPSLSDREHSPLVQWWNETKMQLTDLIERAKAATHRP